MPTYTFYQLDVFTDVALGGNPLAVFPEAEGLDTKTMQALAREMNLSETTFVFPSDKATRQVRMFTPGAEVPLAGHPTIGTWWLLAELGRLDVPEDGVLQITQETGAGVLPVDIHIEKRSPTRVVMVQTTPEFLAKVDDTTALCMALGGDLDVVLSEPEPQVVSTALPQLMIPIRSKSELVLLPSGGAGGELAFYLQNLGTDCAMCFAIDTVGSKSKVHCRMFAPGIGVPEDPATGSAAGALGAYLVQHGLVEPIDGLADVSVEQGIEIGRPSQIDVSLSVEPDGSISEVRVGGKAKTIIKGEVTL